MIPASDPTGYLKLEMRNRQKLGCEIARCDAWKPAKWPGRKFWFVISDFGNGYLVMRLFETAVAREFWMLRVRRWNAGRVQSHGTITWKHR